MAGYKHPAWLGKAMQTGGAVDKSPPNPGEVTNKASSRYLSDKANKFSDSAHGEVLSGFPGVVAGALIRGQGKNLARKIGGTGLAGASAIGGIAAGLNKMKQGWDANREADRFDAADKAEGRKRGGRLDRKARKG